MEKNFYEWLEVDRKASDYVIQKTYKLLAKKYHPDLQEDENVRKKNEELMQHINEAYETLSDPVKREAYDKELEQNDLSKEAFDSLQNENNELRNIIQQLNLQIKNNVNNYNRSNFNSSNSTVSNIKNMFNNGNNMDNQNQYDSDYVEQKINNAVNKAYYDAYIQDLKARGYRIKQKKTWKDYLKFLIAIGITLLILIVFFNLPFVKQYIHDLLSNNNIFESIIQLF